jgi:fucose 4-O-acetylase-like acetyltransferase
MEKEKQSRIEIYDWIRIIATILVVVGHSEYLHIDALYGGIDYILPNNLNSVYNLGIFSWLRGLVTWIYGFHMPLFFFLSGAVLHLNEVGRFYKFAIKKVRHLVVPYLLVGYLYMLPIKYLTGYYTLDGYISAIKGFVRGIDSGHLWFLLSLLWCMLIFVLIIRFFEIFKVHNSLILLIIAVIVHICYSFIPKDVLGIKEGLNMLLYFALGYCFEELRRNINISGKATVFIFALFALLCVVEYNVGGFPDDAIILIRGGFVCSIAGVSSTFFTKVKNVRLYKLLIKDSMYIYLFHDPLEYIVLYITFRYELLTYSIGCIAYVFCRIIGVIIVSIVIGEIINKIKAIMENILIKNKESSI